MIHVDLQKISLAAVGESLKLRRTVRDHWDNLNNKKSFNECLNWDSVNGNGKKKKKDEL